MRTAFRARRHCRQAPGRRRVTAPLRYRTGQRRAIAADGLRGRVGPGPEKTAWNEGVRNARAGRQCSAGARPGAGVMMRFMLTPTKEVRRGAFFDASLVRFP